MSAPLLDNIIDADELASQSYPGRLALSVDLPPSEARNWRLVLEATVRATSSATSPAGTDPLVSVPLSLPLVLAYANPFVLPVAPQANPPMTSGIVVLRLNGADDIVMDYPARGGIYNLTAHKVDVLIYDPQLGGAPPANGARYRFKLVDAEPLPMHPFAGPQYSMTFPQIAAGAGFAGSVPRRAAMMQLRVNDDNAAPAQPNAPDFTWEWYDGAGVDIDRFAITAGTFGNRPPWLWDPWPVPTRAAFFQCYRAAFGASNWNPPSVAWHLVL